MQANTVRHPGDDRGAARSTKQPRASLGERALYLRSFCGADETSTSAAIREAVARLDACFSEQGKRPDHLIVIYRNVHPETMTVDIGMPIDATARPTASAEFRIGQEPHDVTAQTMAEPGFPALLEARDRLLELGHRSTKDTTLVFWQTFESAEFRPWTGHPKAPLYLSVASAGAA